MERDDPAYKGQSGYNPVMLAIYDPWVLGFMANVVLHCPTSDAVERYRRNLRHRHLDVGPGTGYFLEKAATPDTEITLLDPNPHVLHRASKRLEAWHPTTVEADVLKPLPVEARYDSAALAHVLHCLRGPMSAKAAAVRNIADVLEPDGVFFGGTVLGLREHHTGPARTFLKFANTQGAFDNREDTADGLREILDASFQQVQVDVVGSSAYFTATGPRVSAVVD